MTTAVCNSWTAEARQCFKIIIHYFSDNSIRFLGAFSKSRKATIGFVMPVCPSVRLCARNKSATAGRIFISVWYLKIFRKPVEKTQILLTSGKTNECFAWRPMYIYGNISLYSFSKEKYFRQIQGDTKKGTFEKPNKNWRNPRKKIYWQKLKRYNLPFKRQ